MSAALLFVCAACAQPSPASVERRVLAKLRVPSTDAEAIVRQASLVAGVPVRYRAASSPQWHALSLLCPSEPVCDAALQRMLKDTATFAAVEADAVRRALGATPAVAP